MHAPMLILRSFESVCKVDKYLSVFYNRCYLSGKIDVEIYKTIFSPNEVINGSVTMKLDKAIKSKGVFVMLTSGEIRSTTRKGRTVTEHYT